MITENPQLTLKLTHRPNDCFETFFAGDNQLAVDLLKGVAQSSIEQHISMWGASGCGKSHLLSAACQTAHQTDRTATYIPLAELSDDSPILLEGLETKYLIAVDDIDCIVYNKAWQIGLFDLINRARALGACVIIASTPNPATLDILPDLRSRLLWGPVLRITKPGDQQLRLAVALRAELLGLALSDEMLDFLLTHCSREIESLYTALATLEQASLAEQRRLTLPFIRSALG